MKQFLWQWGAELRKMLARKRTFLGFGAFLALEAILLVVFQLDGVERFFRRMISTQGESFDSYFSALTLAYLVVRMAIFLLGGIYLTLVAGDVVAKESEDGNLRLLLTRPISRTRLLAIKFASCLVYCFVLIQFIAWSALLLGVIVRGWGGGLFAFAPEQEFMAFYDAREGLWRYALSTITLSVSMSMACCIAFFFSCWRIKPSAATITALSYLFLDMILRESGFMHNYRHLLITHYMNVWSMVLFENIPWAVILRHYAILAGIGLTLFVAGAAIFESRDLKS
ncbi:ABC transporter permease [Phragmitibacter flavus]|nr:ABC transporter permease [Phragmitibacter flavus]